MMIFKPDDSMFEKKDINILGIDPGTDTIGFSIIKVNIDDLSIIKAIAWTEKISRNIDDTSFETEINGLRFTRLNNISVQLSNILETFNPIVVASEAPFYNRLTPSAYAPLVETLFTINKTLAIWDAYKPLYIIDPPSVKRAVGAKGKANKKKGEDNKDIVKRAIMSIKELKSLDFKPLDSHSVDACAVAYCQLLRLRVNLCQ
jgi:Holliday junction resolvasome RuvABC endonuclease subunit